MCGILSIVNNKVSANSGDLLQASTIIRHRGPDDEGMLTWVPGGQPKIWAAGDTAESTRSHWQYDMLGEGVPFKVGFGHRRLSILDLSPAGHQPMQYAKGNLSICFNGEVYNYLEIKSELDALGHQFNTTCDTEVILHAWAEWGVKCLDKFNGMFAFIMLDHARQELFAVRDRFGVKPLYFYKGANALYLASEIKQIRTSPDYTFCLNEPRARQYMATGAVDHTDQTFDLNIKHIPGGHYLQMDVSGEGLDYKIHKWYTLVPAKWTGTYDAAVVRFRELLTDAVRLRLRSDVKVGSCLSGGLDSSSIVCLASDLLQQQGDFAGQETVTACYNSARYDEWNFALEVINKTGAHPHRVFPEFANLKDEVDAFLWHQDEPTGSTSQFSQWMVFKKTHEAGLKVMIDGQGADEQLAGYSGNDLPLYAGLLGKGQFSALYKEVAAYKQEHGSWPVGFLIGAAQLKWKLVSGVMPARLKMSAPPLVHWLRGGEPSSIYNMPAQSLHENLLRQLYGEPLPALLRYEDHNSMAWSVESRTPFMDYRLLEFTMGLPEQFIYKQRVRKAILRDAMRDILPPAIEKRRDKMGFVTPEELWLKNEGKQWFQQGIEDALRVLPGMFDADKVRKLFADTVASDIPFDFSIWRIVSFGKWYAAMTNRKKAS